MYVCGTKPLDMFHIRTTKTASGSIAVQVVRYERREKIIMIHIGSARSPRELLSLKQLAVDWIKKASRQSSLFLVSPKVSSNLIPLDKCRYLGIHYSFIYDVLSRLFAVFKFHLLHNSLLFDLALMRIIEPASKTRSIELLEEYFNIRHQRRDLYRQLPRCVVLKEQVEAKILMVAKKYFRFDFSWVFYDVTTLYFESFGQDDLRKPGFSKDNKINQPQIVIGLVVNIDGFPIAYEIFEGNKFEGHTLIPVITAFQRRHKIEQLTVVADAAMLSLENMQALNENGLNYIVGARVGNLSRALVQTISAKLNRRDSAAMRLRTEHGTLVCGFSATRYRKDKQEMEKQIIRAKQAVRKPAKIRRIKFLKNAGHDDYELNDDLIAKQERILGVKGYYTNLPPTISNETIIKQYHNLWHVEQAFRVAKSDLRMRPMYHFNQSAIRTHILICFMALAVSEYMEIKTGQSLKTIVRALKNVTDARILNTVSGKEIIMRSEIKNETKQILQKLEI